MENNTTNSKQSIPTSTAIVVAGVLIMIGILVANNNPKSVEPKTLSEQVGVSKKDLNACIVATDLDKRNEDIKVSVDSAMSGLPNDGRGTPYSVVIGKDGVKTDIHGADSYENIKKIVDDAMVGKVTTPYKGNIALSEPTDHVTGNSNATVTIIEYSDFECPYCKQLHPVIERIVTENKGNVKWIYRSWPLHQHSFEKLIAADCVAKLKGDTAFWKYTDLLFGLLKTSQDSISEQL